jgi:hypothetical protein
MGSTQPPVGWVPDALFYGVKRPGSEADHSPFSADVKNGAAYTSIAPHVIMT